MPRNYPLKKINIIGNLLFSFGFWRYSPFSYWVNYTLPSLFSPAYFLVSLNKHEKYSQMFMCSHWTHTGNRINWKTTKFLLKHTSYKPIYSKGIIHTSLAPYETEEQRILHNPANSQIAEKHRGRQKTPHMCKNPRLAGQRQTGLLRARTKQIILKYPTREGTQRVRMMILIDFHHYNTI